MPSARQQYGTWAEDRAADFLVRRGWKIVDRHVTSRYGEIDILAHDDDTLVAVEVKARRNTKFGRAIESMTARKIARLTSALHDIMDKRGLKTPSIRIDLVTVEREGISHFLGIGSG